MRALLLLLVSAPAGAHPPVIDIFREPPRQESPRIIDVDAMVERDCFLDRIHGGECVLRGFEEPEGTDVAAEARDRAEHMRFELVERVLDEIE